MRVPTIDSSGYVSRIRAVAYAFTTLPLRRQRVQTLIVFVLPSSFALTFTIFGRNTRFVRTPMCCPAPPCFLG
jgi:hypothetical protein